MQTATAHVQVVQATAEEIKNDSPQRFPEAASPGDCWRQGDVYITLLAEVPHGLKKVANPKVQLVSGTTQGSRHCLDSLAGVTVYSRDAKLDGPVLKCTQGRTITHPEHGNVILPPGIYGIHHQRDLDAENRERRVLD